MQKWFGIVLVLIIGLSGCAHTSESEISSVTGPKNVDYSIVDEDITLDSDINDPLEGFNRWMWDFNYDILDPYVARPVSVGYVTYIPSPVRKGVSNFLANLDEPSSIVNNVLMGNGDKALIHFNRFWINTFFGIAGLIDIASAAEIGKLDNKEFGDALGHHGVGHGPYVMLPIYGPVTVRNTGDFVDGLYLPLSYLGFVPSVGKWLFEGMESRAALVSQEVLLENSPDPYALARSAYLQRQDFNAEVDSDEQALDDELLLEDFMDEIDAE